MKGLIKGLFAGLFIALLFITCTDPTPVGSELLEEDQAKVDFTDTLTIVSSTVPGDSVRTYSPFLERQLRGYLCGDFEDPVFGRSVAAIYAQPRLEFKNPDFSNTRVDSIVLILPYNVSGVYGDLDQNYGIEVFRVIEDMSRVEEYFSDDSFLTEATPLGRIDNFRPNLDSLDLIDVSGSVPDTLRFPYLRIPLDLDMNLRRDLVRQDTVVYQSDSTFLELFKGIHIRPTTTNAGMLNFDLSPPFLTGEEALAGIYVYYTQQDTLSKQYKFPINDFSVRFTHIEHDYSGAGVESFINNTDLGDSLVFVQAMVGLLTKIEFPFVTNLNGVIINKAELELTLASFGGDDPALYPPVDQLIVFTEDTDGGKRLIEDVLLAGSDLEDDFGGALSQESGKPGVYRMNIGAHFQDMIDGTVGNSIYISVAQRAEKARRAVLFGSRNPDFPIKINVAFTRL